MGSISEQDKSRRGGQSCNLVRLYPIVMSEMGTNIDVADNNKKFASAPVPVPELGCMYTTVHCFVLHLMRSVLTVLHKCIPRYTVSYLDKVRCFIP